MAEKGACKMKLVILRHAEALGSFADPARPLSPQGKIEAQQVGTKLDKMGIEVKDIFHSPKLRAEQTANIVATQLGGKPKITQHENLLPNDPVEPITREILRRDESVMIVSHLPFVRYLTAVLVSLNKQKLPDFPTCCAVVLEREDKIGSWSILHVVTPE